MSTSHVPAWKRAGLVQKKTQSNDKEIEKVIKRNAEAQPSEKPSKAPKRQKLPKDQRKPPPEPDQLAYLRQFHEAHSDWKFSKQKQNWIIRNLFTIPDRYNDAVIAYIGDIKGASRARVVEDARDVVSKWNVFMKEGEGDQIKPGLSDANAATVSTTTSTPASAGTESAERASNLKTAPAEKPADKPTEPKVKPPTEAAARRAQQLLGALEGKRPDLEFLD